MPSPEAICAQVRAALEHESRINLHRYPIQLRCEDGILTVDGEVAHIVAKKLALELAAAVPGVDGLVDRLRVAPTRPMGQYMGGGILGSSQLQPWIHPPMSPVSSVSEEHMLPHQSTST